MSPNAVLLDIGAPDFVDTEAFRPLGVKKDYDGIQIASWDEFKRPFLFIQGAALIPNRRFLRLGHYINKGTPKEKALRNDCLAMTKKLGANIEFPFGDIVPFLKSSVVNFGFLSFHAAFFILNCNSFFNTSSSFGKSSSAFFFIRGLSEF